MQRKIMASKRKYIFLVVSFLTFLFSTAKADKWLDKICNDINIDYMNLNWSFGNTNANNVPSNQNRECDRF